MVAAPVFAFAGSGCLLVLEIVAGRLIAPVLGVSIYTWTSVIGVVLGGVSLGNWLGGRMADRWPTRSALGLVYLAGAAATVLVLGVYPFVESLALPGGAPALLQVVWIVALLFFLPATVLGMPTPILTRLSLDAVEHAGRVVGRIQAAAALGSIAGTFLAGFLLIQWLGTRHVVAGVAGVLLLLAVASRPGWLPRRSYEVASLAVVIVVAGWASSSGCLRESGYYCIRVDPGTVDVMIAGSPAEVRPSVQRLYLDRLLHSYVDISQPTNLLYGYELQYADVLARLGPPGRRVDSFFVGGGGYVFPRYVQERYRGSIVVAEIDPEVTRVAREELALRPSDRMTLVTGDARQELRRLPAGQRFDVVFGDAFDDFGVPYHLTTREFNELVAARLRPGGLYVLNLIDAARHDFLRSELRTLRETFPHVAVVSSGSGWPPGENRETFVVVASDAPFADDLDAVSPEDLDVFLEDGRSVLLTDDHAPVEQLLAPVFAQALEDD